MINYMYVLKVLRSHGLSDAALKDIHRSAVLAKLLCLASSVGIYHSFDKVKADYT